VTCGVAIVVEVAFVPALFVTVVCAWFETGLVAWVGMALFVQVVGVLTMNTAGLKALAIVLWGTLLVFAFVVIATTIVVELALLMSTMMTTRIVVIALSVKPVALALIEEMAHLPRILLLHLLAHLAPCFHLNFFELMALEGSIVLTSLVD
jgi:hypothetical protein